MRTLEWVPTRRFPPLNTVDACKGVLTPLSPVRPFLLVMFPPTALKSQENSDYPCWGFSLGNTAVWTTRGAKQRLFSHPRRLTGRWERDTNNSSSHSSSTGLPGDMQGSRTSAEGVYLWEFSLRKTDDEKTCIESISRWVHNEMWKGLNIFRIHCKFLHTA